MKNWMFRSTAVTTLLSAMVLPAAPSAMALQDDDGVEEIVVTGSYIKRKNQADTASPIQVTGQEDMTAQGVVTMADFAATLTVNSGAQNNPDAFTQNVTTGTSNINLRGLGVASTLVLLNGKRQVFSAAQTDGGVAFVDTASLIPTIAIDQVEILKDGAGPLYGSDAVGGVANFRTRSDFEGLELDVGYQGVTSESQRDLTASAIWGKQFEDTKVMASISYMNRSRLSMRDRDLRTDEAKANGLTISTESGYPGTFVIPTAPIGNLNDTFAFLSVYDQVMPGFANPASPLLPNVIANPSAGIPLPAELAALGFTSNAAPNYFPFPTVTSPDGNVVFPGSSFTGFVRPDASLGQGVINIPGPVAAALGLGDGSAPIALGANGIADALEGLVNPFVHSAATNPVAAQLGVPGSWLSFAQVPNAPGAPLPAFPDPSCAAVAETYEDVVPMTVPITNPLNGEVSNIGTCGYDFNNQFDLVPKEERVQGYADFSHMFDNGTELYGEFGFAVNRATRGNSNFPITSIIPLPANYPFNPWGVDVFWVGRSPGANFVNDRLNPNPSTHKSDTFRFLTGVTGELSGSWTYDVSYMHAENVNKFTVSDGLKTNLLRALSGYGGDSCDPTTSLPGQGNCFFYNVFGTGLIATDSAKTPLLNSDLSPVVDANGIPVLVNVKNGPEVYDYIMGEVALDMESSMQVFDAVTTGDLGTFDGMTISAAFGVQHRRSSLSYGYDENTNNNNFLFVTGANDFSANRDVTAIFGEMLFPLMEDMDIQAALRYEDYGGSLGSTLDPKLAVNYRMADSISLRGSWGTSFRAASIFQQRGNQTTLQSVRDPRSNGEPFVAVRSQGVEDLSPEQSEMYNLGFSWEAFPGLVISLDRWDYKFTDVIVQENAQELVNRALAGGETDLIGSKIFLDPTDGSIDQVTTDYTNAGFIKTNGFDGSVQWTLEDPPLGFITLGAHFTIINDYKSQTFDGYVIDGANSRNRDNFADPMPDFRASAMLGWAYEMHGINAFVRTIGSFTDDQNSTYNLRANGTPDYNNPIEVVTIDDYTTVDLQYNLALDDIVGVENSRFTIGLINAFNKRPPFVNSDGGFETRTHDPRGRLLYANMRLSF